jgi:hypothetical protein
MRFLKASVCPPVRPQQGARTRIREAAC